MAAQIATSMNQHPEFRTSTNIQQVTLFTGCVSGETSHTPECDVIHMTSSNPVRSHDLSHMAGVQAV